MRAVCRQNISLKKNCVVLKRSDASCLQYCKFFSKIKSKIMISEKKFNLK